MLGSLNVVQFENGRYGLQNSLTGIVIDKEFWTLRGAIFSARRRHNRLMKLVRKINGTTSPIKLGP